MATPPTPPPVPFDQHEREVIEVIKERDCAQDAADELAAAVGQLLGVNVGEHSNLNDPWKNALTAAEQAIRTGSATETWEVI